MALHVKDQEIPRRQRVQKGETGEGSMVVKKGYGNECSLMIAVRAPGYHQTPCSRVRANQLCVGRGDLVFRRGSRLSVQTGRFSKNPGQQDSLGVEPLEPKRHRCRSARSGADRRSKRRGCRRALRGRRKAGHPRTGRKQICGLRRERRGEKTGSVELGCSKANTRSASTRPRHNSYVKKVENSNDNSFFVVLARVLLCLEPH